MGGGDSTFSKIAGGIGKAAQYAPAIYNLGQGLFGKADQLNASDYRNIEGDAALSNLQNRRYDINPQLRSNRLATAISRRDIARNAGGRGSLLAGYASLAGQRSRADMGAYAQKQNIENQYASEAAQYASQLGSQNAQNRFRVDDYNARARAAQSGYLQQGLSQLSGISQQNQRNQNLGQADQLRLDALRKMFPMQNINV